MREDEVMTRRMVTAVAALGMALVACTGAEKAEPPDKPSPPTTTQIGAATTCPSWVEGPCVERPDPADPAAFLIYGGNGQVIGSGTS